MEKEFLKESGKYLLDLSKIMFAIAFVTPLVKGEVISKIFITIIFVTSISGLYLIKKGAKDE